MKTLPLRKLFSIFCVFVAFGAIAKANNNVDVSDPEDLGDSTLKITVEAKTAFNRDVESMKITAREAASGYCSAHNKQLRVLSVDGKKPFFATGFTSATIVFKALDANSPELAPPAPAMPARFVQVAAAPITLSASTDDLVAALTKLDDLRKKGILSDEEFQAEKKKLLAHTN